MGWFWSDKKETRETFREHVDRRPLPKPTPKPEHADLWQQCVVAMLSNVDLSKIATIDKHELAVAQICGIADDIVGRRKNIKAEQHVADSSKETEPDIGVEPPEFDVLSNQPKDDKKPKEQHRFNPYILYLLCNGIFHK